MDATSPVLINKALDALSMRYLATAENIANSNSAKFRPVRVNFEDSLKAAAALGPDAVRAVQPRLEQLEAAAGSAQLRLDLELATASETAMRYAALLDLLGRQMQISRTVIRGGQ
jgi:flagellar basal-body rod protein FlgB